MNRRDFLLASGALLMTPVSAWPAPPRFSPVIGACRLDKQQFRIGQWQSDNWTFSTPIDHRGHDSCAHPQREELLFFSRRPGREIFILSSRSGALKQTVMAKDGYHYYGHGCLSHDGRLLYTTENHVAGDGAGAIGIYDCTQSYRCLGHLDCGGIGPHQLALLPDGKTLVVAVGGIKTLPESGRETLNFDTMQPALNYLDLNSGKVVESRPSPHRHLSLRHLDVAADGTVLVGGQFQGTLPSPVPLLYRHQRGEPLKAMALGEIPLDLSASYVASISMDNQQKYAVSTFPRDNLVCLWDVQQARLSQSYRLRDCAGVVYDPAYQQFILSNGSGQLMGLTPGKPALTTLSFDPKVRWDNHLRLA